MSAILVVALILIYPSAHTLEQISVSSSKPYTKKFQMNTGDFVSVRVSTVRNLKVAIQNPDGSTLAEATTRFNNMATIFKLAGQSGDYTLRLSTEQDEAVCEMQIDGPRPATLQDRAAVDAQAAMDEGFNYRQVRDAEKALSAYERAYKSWGEAKRPSLQAEALNYQGLILMVNLNRYREAIAKFQEVIEFYRKDGNQKAGAAYSNLAGCYENIGEFQNALDHYRLAYEMQVQNNDRRSQAYTLNNIGSLYSQLSDLETATSYYEQSKAILQSLNDQFAESVLLNNIALSKYYLGDYDGALEKLEQALKLRVSNVRVEAITLERIGRIYQARKEYDKALEYYTRSRDIYSKTGSPTEKANFDLNIGKLYIDKAEYSNAILYLEKAAEVYRPIGYRRHYAEILYNLARAQYRSSRIVEARKNIEAAIEQIESMRTSITSSRLRALFFSNLQDYYDLYIRILMLQHQSEPASRHDLTALLAKERARGRILLELLSSSQIHRGIDVTLLEKLKQLQRNINTTSEQLSQILAINAADSSVAPIRENLQLLDEEYTKLLQDISIKAPDYYRLIHPAPLNAQQLSECLKKEELLLCYALGDEASYLWVVSSKGTESYTLPARAEIETLARRYYQMLQQSAQTRSLRLSQETDSVQLRNLSRELGRILLPIELNQKRTIIVADGVLQYIPFATLHPKGSERLLLEVTEIVTLPSASIIETLREPTSTPEKQLAVIADPVFDPSDPRVKSNRQNCGPAANSLEQMLMQTRNLTKLNLEHTTIPRLPGTRQEARIITALLPSDSYSQILDFDANLNTVTSSDLEKYAIVHFATHGYVNSTKPEISGLVLSLVDEDGTEKSGFLSTAEIFNLKLNARLVVLSACKTGLGKEIRGEGVVGMLRGFLYAGASSVVYSLWSVHDTATAELMGSFYRKMFKDGMQPVQALRQAQLEMMRSHKWRSPYYWAAFQIQGR